MSAVAMRKRLEEYFTDKPGMLEHIYIDDQDNIRDRHIEHLFMDCWNGAELDTIFTHNFSLYFEQVAARYLADPTMPPPEVFTDELIARAWVTSNFGLLYVGNFKYEDPNYSDALFLHCEFEAKLRTRVADNVDESCYAPTALHATLMTVVNVMRHLAHNFHQELICE